MAPKKRTKKRRLASYKRSKQKREFSFWKFMFYWCGVAMLWFMVIGVFLLLYFSMDLPDVDRVHYASKEPSITIVDKKGNVVANYGRLYGSKVSYEDFPQYLIDAVVATEDRRFFDHIGIDPIGLLRAAYTNYRADRIVQGGSTITQQLAKVTFLTQDRTIRRKIQEMILALHLEAKFSKQEIFTMYMNRIYFGDGNYGIAAAASSYFNKSVSDLTLYESAMLAGLIKAPSRYAPSRHPKRAAARADQVIMNMVDHEVLSTNELLIHDYKLSPQEGGYDNQFKQYPYFASWIKEQLPDYVGGLQQDVIVYTSFDDRLQQIANDTLIKNLNAASQNHHVTQGAMVVLSPDGAVLAMVGGVDHSVSQFNRATQAMRQPGSAFKLFVYLAALEKGLSPNDKMVDEPITIANWSPKNWNDRNVGEVTLHNALAYSINTIAVKIAQKIGMGAIIEVARRLGVTSEIKPNLSSALGSSEVSLLELTAAYAHLANEGNSVWVHGIESIIDSEGKRVYERIPSATPKVLSPQIVGKMNDMLMEVIESGTGKKARIGRMAAGKTGTSQNYRDAWFIGYTADYVVGVWVGNDDNSSMERLGGGNLPAQIWHDFMERALDHAKEKPLLTESTTPAARKHQKTNGFWSLWGSIFGSDNDDDNSQIDRAPVKREIRNGVEIEYR